MAESIHVNGPARISVGAGGTGGGLSDLGITYDGADIEFHFFDDDVIADSGGPRVPIDLQDMGKLAYITFKLVVYDATVLDTLTIRTAAAAAQEPSPGKLFGANSKFRRIVISSPDEGVPYRFFYCHIADTMGLKRGSVRSQPTLRLRSLPGTGTATTMSGIALYDNTAA